MRPVVSLPRPAILPLFAVLALASCKAPDAPTPKAAPVPVTSELIEAGPFQASLTLLGTVEPSAVLSVRAPARGILRVAQGALVTGREVRRGEVLFRVESPDLELAVKEAELQEKSAAHELDRARRGVEGGFLPEADLARREIEHELATERLDGARDALARLTVRAAVGGRLQVESTAVSGMEVAADTAVAEIDAAGAPRVEAWAAAADLARLKTGLAVECRHPGGDRVLGRGRLRELDGRLDEAGVARVVAEIDDDLALPTPGDGVDLTVLLEEKTDAMTVPSQALIVDGSVMSVFVLESSGRLAVARARPVVVGGSRGDRVEILEGLELGERVAVDGAELLADGLEAKDVSAPTKAGDGNKWRSAVAPGADP
ncbi:MAG: efflux RND transporter periplasmic adaptor subunit [Acidobacteriota bacterium]